VKRVRKNLLWISLITLLILSVLSGLSVNMIKVSAAEYPAIYIDPATTVNPALTPGNSYSISIKTNYTGSDVVGWQFTLSYNPLVLSGTSVTDGNLIPVGWAAGRAPGDFDPGYENTAQGQFSAGTFDNNEGTLSLTVGYFIIDYMPMPVVSGPGTLANVNFNVVGIGASNITIGSETKLIGYTQIRWDYDELGNELYGGWGTSYDIIDASTDPENIGHGYFNNVQNQHDVAVRILDVPSTATIEQPVPIEVTVGNEGSYTESVTVTVYRGATVIDTTNFNLASGLFKTVSFTWIPTGLSQGAYTINATATITGDQDLSDNKKTAPITLQLVHDVAVISLEVPDYAGVGETVPIEVTVANEGSYDETVTVKVYKDSTQIGTNSFTLNKGPTNQNVSFTWTGSSTGEYTINATATITGDQDLSDNSKTATVNLVAGDITVTSVVPEKNAAYYTWTIGITVTVKNLGLTNANCTVRVYCFNATHTYLIGTGNIINIGPGGNIKVKTINCALSSLGRKTRTYNIKANTTLTIPTIETNTANNEKVDGQLTVRLWGDVDGNGLVNILDVKKVKLAYSKLIDEPFADIDGNGKIDILDVKKEKLIYSGLI